MFAKISLTDDYAALSDGFVGRTLVRQPLSGSSIRWIKKHQQWGDFFAKLLYLQQLNFI